MRALIDGDIIRYEVGFAAEAGWKAVHDVDSLPPFDYVRETLLSRIGRICDKAEADSYTLYITEGETIRFGIGTVKPYKGTRKANKPWHFDNITAYMKSQMNLKVITEIEADDAMVMDHGKDTIICSRDKDLRQAPGWFLSWELGKQPSFGPTTITKIGHLELSDGKPKKLSGSGLVFFYSQMLTGDVVDNIPGLPKCGPVAAYDILNPILSFATNMDDGLAHDLEEVVANAYQDHYGHEWEERMIEQGQLCWLIRRYNPDGTPELWRPGLIE